MDAWIAQHQDPTFLRSTDESSHTLLERDDGLRDLVLQEGAAAVALDPLDLGLGQGILGCRERELVDNHERQRLAAHIHAFPEALGPEEHRNFARAKTPE
jgi:hypothetical protein